MASFLSTFFNNLLRARSIISASISAYLMAMVKSPSCADSVLLFLSIFILDVLEAVVLLLSSPLIRTNNRPGITFGLVLPSMLLKKFGELDVLVEVTVFNADDVDVDAKSGG